MPNRQHVKKLFRIMGSEIFSGDFSNTENKHAPPHAVAEISLNFDS